MHESSDEFKFWQICNSSNFGKFATELLPLIDVRIEFLFNILKTNRPIKAKFCKHIIYYRQDLLWYYKSLFITNWQQSYGP